MGHKRIKKKTFFSSKYFTEVKGELREMKGSLKIYANLEGNKQNSPCLFIVNTKFIYLYNANEKKKKIAA